MRIIEKIPKVLTHMSETDKKIYELIVNDPREFSLKSIGDIAEKLSISKTSLVRFSKNIGFDGYATFKKSLQEEEILDILPAEKLSRAISGNYSYSISKIKDREVKNIEDTIKKLKEKDIEQFIEKILSSNMVYTMGWGSSALLAEMMSIRLSAIGIKSFPILRGKVTISEQILQLRKGDLLIIFEYPSYVKEVIDSAALAHRRGIDIVLVTDKENCPIVDYASLIFYCSAKSEFFGNSLTAPMFFITIMATEIMLKTKDTSLKYLREQENIYKDKNYFI